MNTKLRSVLVCALLVSLSGCCGPTAASARKRGVTPLPNGEIPVAHVGPVNGPVTINTPGPVSVQPALASQVTINQGQPTAESPAPAEPMRMGVTRPGAPTIVATPTSSSPIMGAPAAAPINQTGAASADIELKKETFGTSKATVPNGEVVVSKVVTSQNVGANVPLNVEDVTVERVPANGQPTTPFGEQVVAIPLNREQAAGVVTPVVKEVVHIRKIVNTVNTNVTGVVREEDIQMRNNKIQ